MLTVRAIILTALVVMATLFVSTSSSAADEDRTEHMVLADFEADDYGAHWPWGGGHGRITQIGASDEQAHTGRRSLEIHWRFTDSATARDAAFMGFSFGRVRGEPVQYTFHVHADRPGVRLSALYVDGMGETFVRNLATLDWRGWRQITVPIEATGAHWGGNNDGKLDPPACLQSIGIGWQDGAAHEGAIYIDDMEVVSVLPLYGDITIGYDGPRWLANNRAATFHVDIEGYRTPDDVPFDLHVQLVPPDGQPVSAVASKLTIHPTEGASADVTLPIGEWRSARLEASLQTEDGQIARRASLGELFFLPEVAHGSFDDQSIYGICGGGLQTDDLAAGGIKWLRVTVWFRRHEAVSEKLFNDNLQRFEKVLAACEANSIRVLPILNPRQYQIIYQPGGRPATTEDARALNPTGEAVSLTVWADWVRRVVTRYRDRVKYWEISNEPNGVTTAQQYTAINNIAYIMAKRADPDCYVGAFATGVDLPFIETCLKSGIGGYFDFVTVHPYQWSHSFSMPVWYSHTKGLEELLARYDCPSPIWFTEIGWATHPRGGLSQQLQAAVLAQMYLTAAADEKHRVFWYCSGDWGGPPTDQEGYFGIIGGGGRPKPSFYAYYTVARTLAGARSLGALNVPDGYHGWRYLLPDGQLAAAVWCDRDPPAPVRIELPNAPRGKITQLGIDLSRQSFEVPNGSIEVLVGRSPVLLIYQPGVLDLKLGPRPPLVKVPQPPAPQVFLAAPSLPAAVPGQRIEVPFSVMNGSDNDATGAPHLRLPDGWGDKVVGQPMTVAPLVEGVGRITFDIPAAAVLGRHELQLEFVGCRPVTVELLIVSPLSIDVQPLDRPLEGANVPLTVLLNNPNALPTNVDLDLHVNGATIQPQAKITATVAANSAARFERFIDAPHRLIDPAVQFTGVVGNKPFNLTRPIDSVCIVRVAPPLKIDGHLDDWSGMGRYRLGRMEQARPLKRWWAGPDDLSADVMCRWDEEHFYFAAVVTDDVHAQPGAGGSMWMGDSFQLAFEADDQYAYEFTIGHTGEGPQVFCHRSLHGETGLVADAKLATRRHAKQLYYELAIPWSQLKPLSGEAGTTIRFNFILNENDAAGRLGYLACRPGIGHGKSTRQFLTWPLR